MFSILILTKNEENDILQCLQSVSFSDDIHVFDSGSTDNTVMIAEKFGAVVTIRNYGDCTLPFGGDEAAHRNWGLQNISFKNPWLFVLDADERMTKNLVHEINSIINFQSNYVAFRVRRRDFFIGTWLKHVQTSPYYMRLIRPEKIRHERLINTLSIADGPVGDISGYFDHFPFSKGIGYWIERHNGYSRFEAEQITRNRLMGENFSLLSVFIAKDFHTRRFHQKELFYRLPLRPFVKFLLLYVIKRGFLDGRAGFTYALLQSIYEYFIVLKVKEIEAAQRKKV